MKRQRMGVCPVCEQEIYTDQHTVWRAVDDAPARVHGECLDPPITRRAVQR